MWAHKKRTRVEANFQKIQLQNRQANTNFLLSSINCRPNYYPINYVETCKKCPGPIIIDECPIIDGLRGPIFDGSGGFIYDGMC